MWNENEFEDFNISEGSVVGIESPTGSGKSTGTLRFLDNHAKKFGQVLFIEPTTSARESLQLQTTATHIRLVTIHEAICLLLRSPSQIIFSTFVLDECHILSRDYLFVWKILCRLLQDTTRPRQYFFLSACLPKTELKKMFPTIQICVWSPPSPFPTTMYYETIPTFSHYPCVRHILQRCIVRMKNAFSRGNKKILIFVASRNNCETLAGDIKTHLVSTGHEIPVLVLHGGLEKWEKQEVYTSWNQLDAYVLISTNILESSVTIPGLEVVIDTGLECRYKDGFFCTVYVTKTSFLQRAGRVGRTTEGSVYRLITFEEYQTEIAESLPFDHDMSVPTLQILNRGFSPHEFLDEEEIQPTLHLLREHGISCDGSSSATKFLETCAFSSLSLGLVLHSLDWNRKDFAFFISLIIHVLEFYEVRHPRWFFRERGEERQCTERYRAMQEELGIQEDSMLSLVHVLVVIFEDKKTWRKKAETYSLHIRTLREFFVFFQHSMKRIQPKWDLGVFFQKGITLFKKPTFQNKIRWFFLRNRYTSYIPVRTHWACVPFAVSSSDQCCLINCKTLYSPHHAVMPLSMNETFMQLWIDLPVEMDAHPQLLKQECHSQFVEREYKRKYRKEFKSTVIDQFNNEVAYRPGMVKMLEAGEHFGQILLSRSQI